MRRASILIVEDDGIIAADLASRLREFGYDVTATVRRGEDAVAVARERAPDLVLMDIRLAGSYDGIEAAEMIRRDRDIPVVLLTAHSDRETMQRAQLAGLADLVPKPFDEHELRTQIERALGRWSVEHGGPKLR